MRLLYIFHGVFGYFADETATTTIGYEDMVYLLMSLIQILVIIFLKIL